MTKKRGKEKRKKRKAIFKGKSTAKAPPKKQ